MDDLNSPTQTQPDAPSSPQRSGQFASDAQPISTLPYLVAAVGFLVVSAALNLWAGVFGAYDLSGDEAHYWEWSRQLDWSYYSKGPLVAYLIAAGGQLAELTTLGVPERLVLGVRAPAALLSILTGLGLFALTRLCYPDPRAALVTVLLTATVPIMALGSGYMTIDAPLMALWVWCLVLLAPIFSRDEGTADGMLLCWISAGVLIALGILAKYNMLFMFGVVGAVMLFDSRGRRLWRAPGPYLMGIIAALGFLPILVWNMQHNWVSFRHVAGQAGLAPSSEGPVDRLGRALIGPLEYAFGQLGVMNAVWLVLLVGICVSAWRSDHLRQRFLVAATVVPFAVFLGFSPLTKIQPNWPLTGIVAGLVLLSGWMFRHVATDVVRNRTWVIRGGAGFGLLVLAGVHLWPVTGLPMLAGVLGGPTISEPTPLRWADPFNRLRGWRELGVEVGKLRDAFDAQGPEPIIVADHYQIASQVAFYTPGNPTVYCAQPAFGERQSQYDIWAHPLTESLDRPVIYVGTLRPMLTETQDGRPAVMPGLSYAATARDLVAGAPVREFAIFTAPRLNGFDPALFANPARY